MNYIDRLQLRFLPQFESQARKKRVQKKIDKRKLEQEKAKEQESPIVNKEDGPKKLNVKDAISKVKEMDTPTLLLVNSNLTTLSTDTPTEEEKAQGQENYKKFLSDDKNESILKESINLTNIDGIHSWICPANKVADLDAAFLYRNIAYQEITLPSDFSTHEDPFDTIKISLQGIDKASKVKMDLKAAWEPVAEILVKDKPEETKEEPKAEKPVEEEPKKKEQEEEKTQPEEEEPTEEVEETEVADEEEDEADEGIDVGDAPRVNVGKLRSLRDPYIFMLDPRKRYPDYKNFLGPDEEGEPKKASQVLPRAIKFLVSKKIKSTEGAPVIVYFLDQKDAILLQQELRRESRPHYYLAKFDKQLFDEDEPFGGFKVNDTPLETLLEDELNNVWVDITSEVSGNPVSAVQATTSVPLNFFRFLSKKQRPIQFYIGNQPEGAGSSGIIYVLASEREAELFVKNVRRFKLPSLFYERMSSNSDIDAGFKTIDPEDMQVANVLILTAKDKFEPKEQVQITEAMLPLLPKNISSAFETAVELKKKLPSDKKLKKIVRKDSDVSPEQKRLLAQFEQARKVVEDFAPNVTQLYLLHAFARWKLKSTIKHPGTFIAGGSPVIGTHIANFNANMSLCFLWGSLTQHVTVDSKEVLEQLPFVKSVITSYL